MIKELKDKVLYKIAMLKQPKIDIDALKERLEVQKWVTEDFQFISARKLEEDASDKIVV